jgi:hypothetical protein
VRVCEHTSATGTHWWELDKTIGGKMVYHNYFSDFLKEAQR